MKHLLSTAQRVARVGRLVSFATLFRLLLLALLLAGPGRGWAQAPTWELAMSCSNNQFGTNGISYPRASAVDANGNVFVTGDFGGTVAFSNIRLASAGRLDIFVAKWDATARAFTWATSGGGTGDDYGTGIAVSGTSVFVTGYFTSGTNVSIAGQALTGTGSTNMFVAKYNDTSTGNTPATSSFNNAWVTSGGSSASGTYGQSIAVSGTSVFVTGSFFSGTNTRIAGQTLTGAGRQDIFVAKYVDTSTGTTPSTSSFANAWATSGGGTGVDYCNSIAVSGRGVFITGSFQSNTNTSIAGQTLNGTGTTSSADMFVAKFLDTSTGSTPATSSFANAWATSGGGTDDDRGWGIAISGTGVFVTGQFISGTNAHIAGQTLAGAGATDMFVAKYLDTSTGNTSATSSFANAWATSGGGFSNDHGQGIAVRGTSVFCTGRFVSGTNARIAGQTLTGMGSADMFLAKYVDTSTGNTPATSSYANAWATNGGGSSQDSGIIVVTSGQQVYALGWVAPPVTFGPFTFGSLAVETDFIARLTDPTLLAAYPEALAASVLTLVPNPAHASPVTLCGSAPGTAVQVLDALGRVVTAATADVAGTATLPIIHVPGVYTVRNGSSATRLLVE